MGLWHNLKKVFTQHFLISKGIWLALPAGEAERHRKAYLVRFICLLMAIVTQADSIGNLSVLFEALNRYNPSFDYKTEVAFDTMEQGLVFGLFFLAFSSVVNSKNYYRLAVILAISGFTLCSYAYLGTPNFLPLLFYYILLCSIVAIVLDNRWLFVATSFATLFLTGLRLENLRVGQNLVQAGLAYSLTGIIVVVLVVRVPAQSQAALLIAKNEQLEETRRESLEAQENERGRLATELHDTAISQINLLRVLVSDKKTLNEEQLQLVQVYIDRIENSVRDTTRNLHATQLKLFSLDLALQYLVEAECEAAGLDFSCKVDDALYEQRFAKQIEHTIYRIVQQALANTTKHANATEFEMVISWDKPKQLLLLEVSDNGVGFELPSDGSFKKLEAQNHFGLAGFERRVRDVHGTLVIQSAPNAGTRIKVTVPALQEFEV